MRAGSGSFTRLRMAMILALRWTGSSLVWVSSTSSICWPQGMTGLSAVIGSWNIIDMRVQRSSRSRASPAARMFSPSSRISPDTGFSALASSPMTVKAITDLPEPDSPTRQTISPGLTVKLTFSTAWARSAPAGRATVRLRTSRTGFFSALIDTPNTPSCCASHFLAHLRIERVAQAVAHDVHGQHRQCKEDAGIEDVVREHAEQGAALGHDVAPARDFRRDADAEEGQDRLGQDGGGGDEGALHDQGRDGVGQDVAEHQGPGRRADRDGALDIGLLAHREHHGAHQAHDSRHVGHDDGEDHGDQAGAPDRDQRDGEQYARYRHQPVHDAHDDAVEPSDVAGDQADDEADRDGDGGDGDADRQRHARAVNYPAVDVTTQAVGAHEDDTLDSGAVVEAEGDLGARLLVACRRIDARRIHGAEDRRQDGDRQHDQKDGAADNDGRVADGESP